MKRPFLSRPFPSFLIYFFLPFYLHHRHPFAFHIIFFGFFLHKLAFKFILKKKQIFCCCFFKSRFFFYIFIIYFAKNCPHFFCRCCILSSLTQCTPNLYIFFLFFSQRSQRSRRDDTFSIFIIYFLQFINK